MKKELKGWVDINDALPPAFNNVFVKSEKGMFNSAVVYGAGLWRMWDSFDPLKDTFNPTHWISKEDILSIN